MMKSSEKYQIINLKNSYPSIYNVPVINRVENSIFSIRYYTYCLSCNFCNDICCSRGVDVDIDNVERIMMYASELEKYTNTSRTEWFLDNYKNDKEFPGSQYTRTATKDGLCIFIDRNGRGCMIHKFCASNNIDFHILKPMISSLFPLTFDEGLLHPSDEASDDSLICLHEGPTLYEGVREELIYYFGFELAKELDFLQKEFS